MEAVVACDMAAMDFNALSRRELQALCKLNGVRANMTNLAMVEALHSLPSVDGIDQIGTTLCLPTPGKSAMKSALRTAPASDQQQPQQGSPLPRGRRVSLKSPEAFQTDRERGLVKEIVRTPGVALRSTNRRPRATPAPTPTPATLRRSQRSTARKAAAPVEVDVATARRSARKTAKLNMAIDFDQEDDEAENAQGVEETKGAASDGPEEEEVITKLMEGNNEADEPEQGEEVASSVAPIECADKSCDDSKVEEAVEEPTKLQEVVSFVALIESAEKSCDNSKVEEVVEEATKPQEGAAIGEEQMLVNIKESVMEDSPIFGVLSKVAPETAMKNFENASTEGFGSWSPVLEIADEINCASEDKEDAAVEVPKEGVKEDATSPTFEAADADSKIILADVTEKEVDADELPQADTTDDESAEEYGRNGKSSDETDLTEESSQEDGLDEDEDASEDNEVDFSPSAEADDAPNKMTPAAVTEKKVAADELPQVDPIEDESESDLTEESSEEDEDMENVNLTVDGESDETIEASNSTEVNFDSDEEEELEMLEIGEEMKDYDPLTGEEDDFSGDLSSEFDSIDFSDAETESNSSPVALEGIHAAAPSSAAKNVDSTITEDIVSSEGDEVSQHVETTVESLDKVASTEAKKEECAKEKKQVNVGEGMSLRKLKSAYKESLIAAKEGKKLTIDADEGTRAVLAELDDNAKC
ncbi:translation initiation factor IF-2-like [Lolium rigidum]|uniref:translation initiation factor IF-2-like n=1 Tax=Lolium rigidum TaxID=89674 RepID=UPI001F5C87C3|nr:translation initiation factor IF-2-like [Lolium rigidum]